MANNENPALPAGLRVFSGAVVLVLLVGGGLFFVPDLVRPRWPWPLAPFNARFLGSFYLAEMVAMVALLVWNRWSPARMILVMAFVFTAGVAAISLFHLDQFNFARKSPWVWFALYLGSAIVSGWFLWQARATTPVAATVSGSAWRSYFRTEALLFEIYGIGLIMLPVMFTAFWPWPIDVFHAQAYSMIFITAAAGNPISSACAARGTGRAWRCADWRSERSAILGLVITDATVKRVDWAAPGP